ncbi:unnamed protein product, partial [Rotaria magnacalcarata]
MPTTSLKVVGSSKAVRPTAHPESMTRSLPTVKRFTSSAQVIGNSATCEKAMCAA